MSRVAGSSETGEAAAAPRRRGRRWIRRGAWCLTAATLVAGAGLWWLLATTAGARWTLARIAARAPVEVGWLRIEGSLAGPLTLRGVVYGSGAADLAVEVDALEVDWRLRSLARGRLAVERLRAAGVRIELPPPSAQVGDAAPVLPQIELPVDVVLAEARIEGVSVLRRGEALIAEAELDLAGRLAGGVVEIRRLAIAAPALGAIEAAGTVERRHAYALDLELGWRAVVPQLGDWLGSGRLSGDLQALQLAQTITAPLAAVVTGRVLTPLAAPSFDGRVDVEGLELARLSPNWPALRIDGGADLSGTLDDYTLAVEADLVGSGGAAGSGLDRLPPTRLRLAGRGGGEALQLQALRAGLLGGTVEARGTLGWAAQATWDLELRAADLDPASLWPDWPGSLSLEAASAGRMTPAGPVATVRASKLDGTLRQRQFAGRLDLRSEGERFRIEALELEGGLGRLQAAGEVAGEWDLSWDLRAPDLSAFPGAGGSLTASGTLVGPRETPRLRARVAAQGLARGYDRVAELQAEVDVSLAEAAALSLDVEARDLEIAERRLAVARVAASGTLLAHQVNLTLRAAAGDAALRAEGAYDDEVWDGRLDALELRSARLGRWRLERAAAVTLGAVTLGAATIGAATARLGELCARGDGESGVCLRGERAADGSLQGSGELKNLPLTLIEGWLPPRSALTGDAFSGRFAVARAAPATLGGPASAGPAAAGPAAAGPAAAGPAAAGPAPAGPAAPDPSAASPWTAELRLEPVAGTWRYSIPEQEPLELSFRLHPVQVELTPEGLTASSRLQLGGGRLELAATLPGYRPEVPLAEQPLAGHLRGAVPDLWWLAVVYPVLEDVEGRLDVDLELAGTALRPAIEGQAKVVGRAVVPELGLDLRDVEIEARSHGGEALEVLGSLRSGEGELTLTGALPLPPSAEDPAELRLVGRQFLALNTPHTRMRVSMDLETRVDDERVVVAGRVRIPQADLRLASGPTAVPVSADAVVVGGAGPEPRRGPRLAADLSVELGDAVAVAGEGFSGRLSGRLGVRARSDGGLLGTGELLIRQGTYTAYGQNLGVDEGRVTFTSSPIDDPGLNIRAYREAQDDVVAGLHIRGTLTQPLVELYSVPAMPQMDALSYLLFGRKARGEENPDLATSAALSLGLAGSKAVLGRLGLDRVTIDPGRSVDDAALVLGTYIGPDLFVSYGFGLFRSLHILRLRYDIDRHWSLQAEQSEEETAGDILYSIER